MTLQIFPAYASDKRAAEDGEVLAEDEDRPTVHRAVTGDDAVAEERLVAPVAGRDEGIELDERSRVEEQVDALAGGQLAGRMLLVDAVGTTPEPRCRSHLVEAAQPVCVVGHGIRSHRSASLRKDAGP